MKHLLVGVAAAFIMTAGPAAAEGLPPMSRIKAPGTVIGPNWNGFYVGVGIGGGVASHDVSGKKEKKYCKTWWCGHCLHWEHYTESFSDSDTSDIGVFGTVTVGLDRVLRPGWVGGVFADYDFGSNISGDVSLPHYSLSLDHNSSWAVGARLGYLVTPLDAAVRDCGLHPGAVRHRQPRLDDLRRLLRRRRRGDLPASELDAQA